MLHARHPLRGQKKPGKNRSPTSQRSRPLSRAGATAIDSAAWESPRLWNGGAGDFGSDQVKRGPCLAVVIAPQVAQTGAVSNTAQLGLYEYRSFWFFLNPWVLHEREELGTVDCSGSRTRRQRFTRWRVHRVGLCACALIWGRLHNGFTIGKCNTKMCCTGYYTKRCSMQALEKLIFLIEEAGLIAGSEYKLAKRMGIPQTMLTDWKAGRRACSPADRAILAGIAGQDAKETSW